MRKQGIFITGTGTDVGKTYVTALLIKQLRQLGIDVGYYKAAISGSGSIEESDAGYVNKIANIGQEQTTLLSYLYQTAVSPHLAAKLEGNPVELEKIKEDFQTVKNQYEYVVMEGSGGIVCPIRYDNTKQFLLEDIIKELNLDTVVVANAGLGTINSTVLTVEYLRQKKISIQGIFLNFYTGSEMEEDNKKMIEALTGVPILATIRENMNQIKLNKKAIKQLLGGDYV